MNSPHKFLHARPTHFASATVKVTVTGFFVVVTLSFLWLCRDSNNLQTLTWAWQTGSSNAANSLRGPQRSHSRGSPADDAVAKLIQDIREAVKLASGGRDASLSAEDRAAWEGQFPCRSRLELEGFYQRRKNAEYVPVNEQWQAVLAEYAILHRVCTSRVGDLLDYFLSKNESTGCRFLIAEAHFGLGNKVLHHSSLLMYAVLTQRVILLPESTAVPGTMCQPFPGSSWSLQDSIHEAVVADRLTSSKLYAFVDEFMWSGKSMPVYASSSGAEYAMEKRFWCNKEQSMLSRVTWLTIDGCVHLLPMLFAIDKFRPILEQMFPTRMVLSHVLRTAMLPADPVWELTVAMVEEHLEGAEKQVGVQVRYLSETEKANKDLIHDRFTDCLWENGFLPKVCSKLAPEKSTAHDGNCSSSLLNGSVSTPMIAPQSTTNVLIASLTLTFRDHLQEFYLDDKAISIVQPTHEEEQDYGPEIDRQALAEIMALSLSDVLLVTPSSTFGGLAQAYGLLVPYFVEYRPDVTDAPCQRGLTTEPCDLTGVAEYECRYDPPKYQSMESVVPYLQRCMPIDVGDGYATLLMNNDKLDARSA